MQAWPVESHVQAEEEAENDDTKPAQKQTARRRAYAKRSCLKCREKKARCELPDLSIPSSMEAVTIDKACHRCKVLALDCVVWDGDRKRKPRILPSTPASSSSDPQPKKRKKPDSARSPGSLDQLAAAAARVSDKHKNNGESVMSPPTDASPVASSSREPVSTLASVQFFHPAVDEMATPSSSSSPYPTQRAEPTVASSSRGTPSDSKRRKDAKPSARTISPPGRTWTSLWRPLSVLIDYAAQQPAFTTYLVSRVDAFLPPKIDVLDLIDHKMCLHLKPFIRPYLLWHPHLPSLEALYDEHRASPTVSTALLLTTMCLIACRHAMSLTDGLPRKLSALVDQLGTYTLSTMPQEVYTVQALELLLAHEPSLIGTLAAGQNQADRGNSLLGEPLLTAALTIAKKLKLDTAIDTVANILATPSPSDADGRYRRRMTLTKAMDAASIWISLRIWEGHFSFVNSTVRPIDLAPMVEPARALIAIDNDGIKIERRDRDPFVLIEQRFPGMDEDGVLRSAGRTGLVYRLMTMNRFQSAIADFYRILLVAAKPEFPNQAPTTHETRAEISASLASVLMQRDGWEYIKMQDFAVFSSVRPALLLEDWMTMESYSLLSLLPCLAICAYTTGELNRGFSAIEMIELLRNDESFRKQSTDLGVIRDNETHKLLSAFYLFDRGLGYSKPDVLSRMTRPGDLNSPLLLEATGAPLLLTTAFATDGCKTFLEKTACSLAGFSHLPDTANMHMNMMLQTLQRLQECDRNRYIVQPVVIKRSAGRRTTLSPHDRLRPPGIKLESVGAEDDEEEVGRSISQIGIVFIEDMVQAMSKWKLGMSLHRQEAFQHRILLARSGATPSTPLSATGSTPNAPPRSVPHDSQRGTMSAPPIDTSRGGNGEWNQNYPHQDALMGNALALTNVQGGMFDIPMFDGLFQQTVGNMDQWANSVPWFDPVTDPSGMSLGVGSSMLQPPHEQSPMHRDAQLWPPNNGSIPQHRSGGHNTLPPLLSISTPPPPPQAHGQMYAPPPQNYHHPYAGASVSHQGPYYPTTNPTHPPPPDQLHPQHHFYSNSNSHHHMLR